MATATLGAAFARVLRRAGLTIAAAWLVLSPCACSDDEDGSGGRFIPRPCGFTPVDGFVARCGAVEIPDGAGKVSLAVAVFTPKDVPLTGAPVVYLSGGPGGAAIDDLAPYVDRLPFARDRALVLFDQRGTGRSQPSLACPELERELRDELARGADGPTNMLASMDALSRCRLRLSGDAIALERYRTTVSADDVEILRQVLGYPRWSLWGISYGTRLALEVMRRHPAGIDSAVLDSVVPPDVHWPAAVNANFERALREVEAACGAQAACAAAFPQVLGKTLDVAARLDAGPITVTLADGAPARIDGSTFLSIVELMMYSSQRTETLPRLVYDVDAGRMAGLTVNAQLLLESSLGVSYGAYFSVVCADALPLASEGDATAVSRAVTDPRLAERNGVATYYEACRRWSVAASPPDVFAPVIAATRTLVLSGRFDPITPPAWGERVAVSLPNAHALVVPSAGHGASLSSCGMSAMQAFLSTPTGLRPSCPASDALVFEPPVAPGVQAARVDQPSVGPLPKFWRPSR